MYEQSVADRRFLVGEEETAAAMYLEGARDGDARAAFNYGYCLLYGRGVPTDFERAREFFMFARDLEQGEACYNLAMLYLHGTGVVRDYHRAFSYMRAAAEMGCVEAQLYLGTVYTTGCMFEPDVVGISLIPCHTPIYRSTDTFLLEGFIPDAEADEDARFSVCSADGREAFLWFRTAAHHDPTYVSDLVAKGQYLYAKCYVDGLGTDYDHRKAARLMLAAGKSGSQEAIAYLQENNIRPEYFLTGGMSGDGR